LREIEIIPTEFVSSDEMLRGHIVKPLGNGPYPGICKFHGLPGSSDQVHGVASSLAFAGFLVLTFDFRGFRHSEGTFSLAGQIDDAHSAISHILSLEWTMKDWTGVFGASFGAAIAVCTAARDERIRSICLRAPVYDTRQFAESQVAELVLNDIAYSVPDEMHGIEDQSTRMTLLNNLRSDAMIYNPMNDISKLSPRSIFITTGDSDMLIDVDGVRRFYERASKPKKMVVIRGADHNLSNMITRLKTEQGILEWFKREAII